MARFINHPKYSTGFDTANYRMIVPEGYARYAVIEGLGPGGAALDVVTECTPPDAFQVDFPGNDDPKPPPGANVTIRIGAKKPGSGRLRLLFKGNDYSQPLPVQVTPDSDGTVRALQESFRLSSQALGKAKERLEELRKSLVAAMGSMAFQANWFAVWRTTLSIHNRSAFAASEAPGFGTRSAPIAQKLAKLPGLAAWRRFAEFIECPLMDFYFSGGS
jgi:hypothetical protein